MRTTCGLISRVSFTTDPDRYHFISVVRTCVLCYVILARYVVADKTTCCLHLLPIQMTTMTAKQRCFAAFRNRAAFESASDLWCGISASAKKSINQLHLALGAGCLFVVPHPRPPTIRNVHAMRQARNAFNSCRSHFSSIWGLHLQHEPSGDSHRYFLMPSIFHHMLRCNMCRASVRVWSVFVINFHCRLRGSEHSRAAWWFVMEWRKGIPMPQGATERSLGENVWLQHRFR